MKYEQLEHTADIAIKIYGGSLKDLFIHAAEAFFDIIGSYHEPEQEISRSISLSTESIEDLLHDWLAEMNYLHQTHREVYFLFDIQNLQKYQLKATIKGESIDPNRHNIELDIKAVTYHQLSVQKTTQGWQAFVIFDI